MTTAIQRTSLGELGYTPLSATSLGELGTTVLIVPRGGITDAFKLKKGLNQDEEELQFILMMVTIIEQDRLQ